MEDNASIIPGINASRTAVTPSLLPSYPMPVQLNFIPGGVSYNTDNNNDRTNPDQNNKMGKNSAGVSNDHTYLLSTFSYSDNIPERSSSSSLSLSMSGTPRSGGRGGKFFGSPMSEVPRLTFLDNSAEHKAGIQGLLYTPDWLAHKARLADDLLNYYVRTYHKDVSQPTLVFLPSLSVLANAAFGRLTGVPPLRAKTWADAMVLQYSHDKVEDDDCNIDEDGDEKRKDPPAAMVNVTGSGGTTVAYLKKLLEEDQLAENGGKGCEIRRPRRPCGHSDHEGHEVYFHRTTPGGCCDCGDAEAWKPEGCCPVHRPLTPVSSTGGSPDGVDDEADPEEAVRMAQQGLKDGLETLRQAPTKLEPKLAAALAAVIGAAVRCVTEAVDGAGVGADPAQWQLRWADEACRIWNGVAETHDYHNLKSVKQPLKKPSDFLPDTTISHCFPGNYKLQLRLHNDDVHTFDEVIDALRGNMTHDGPVGKPLVTNKDEATQMTHHVDADGQVTVKMYTTIQAAMEGYKRLKSRGLHCAVVSSAQFDMEQRARHLLSWLSEISAAHPSAAVLVVHALLQIKSTQDLGGISVWQEPRMIPTWVAPNETDEMALHRRFKVFPPHLATSYLTGEEAEKLHAMAMKVDAKAFLEFTGESQKKTRADPTTYSNVPYRLPSAKYRKSPHSLWGTLPSLYDDSVPIVKKHPLLSLLKSGKWTMGEWDAELFAMRNDLTETVYVIDTDLRKQQEADQTLSTVFSHRLPGLYMISGVGTIKPNMVGANPSSPPNPMEYRPLLAASSFRAPVSPAILLLLLDPYPTKQLRGAIHSLFLSLLTDARFKCRFAAALGIAYRPLSTLFCAGVGTEADTPLGFTVQIFTAGSLVRALGSAPAAAKLLLSDDERESAYQKSSSIGVFTVPIALTVVRCIHTNLLGATKEVHMILNNTANSCLAATTYVAGEHPIMTLLPTAPDDGYLDSRSTRHKRLPHLLRDLEYVIETPGTAMRILLPKQFPPYRGMSLSSRGEEVLTFCTTWARLLRLAQGMDPQKRKTNGGHVEYEQSRWLEAFGLSLNFAGTRDALAESPTNSSSAALAPVSEDGSHLVSIREAMGNIMAALLKEIKLWLYKEGMLETGLPAVPRSALSASDQAQVEALQRSTLHIAASQIGSSSPEGQTFPSSSASTVALACATSVKMRESQLILIENALKLEGANRRVKSDGVQSPMAASSPTSGAVMGDWLRVPHSPLSGDSLSFHLPLHRALAKTIRSLCAVVVPESIRNSDALGWWKLPVVDIIKDTFDLNANNLQHPLVPLIRPTLRPSNCRVVWSAGPDCNAQEAQRRRDRSRTVSANIAVAKIIHSLVDHPIRCLAAAQQIERHLWARNGTSVAGMALNYSNAPLCRSFRDLDLALVQLSASGMSVGLGARRVLTLLINRFSMDGYLCDPERRSTGNSTYATGLGAWIIPPRLQDPDYAPILSESLFSTLCILVTELPPPPPISSSDETWLRQSIRRELIHALAAEPRSHSAAMAAASCAVGRRDESDGSAGTSGGGGLFRDVFAKVLKDVGKQKTQGSRGRSGPSTFELSPSCCEEYDPTFFHLRRQEHQHAMDVVSSLRKQKLTRDKGKESAGADASCFPLVCVPPKAHPRFIACRLMLHLSPMDAAIRRALLFALCGGAWFPPSEPVKKVEVEDDIIMPSSSDASAGQSSFARGRSIGDVPIMTRSRRSGNSPSNPFQKRAMFNEGDSSTPFSAEVVAASSVSFLEELQLLTLQVHTLEECASLHRLQPDLDDEAKSLSSGLSINSYLGRLVHVPESLLDVWALRQFPNGPLKSKGSGECRGSILGLLIALYEYRGDHGAGSNGGQEEAGEGHGGARALTSSGLKWLLRFVNALVDGAPSVATAVKSATTGVPLKQSTPSSIPGTESNGTTIWSIDETVRVTISGMLSNLPDLWPKAADDKMQKEASANEEKKERGKIAQQRMLEMMRKKQSAFEKKMGTSDKGSVKDQLEQAEDDLCIICRCVHVAKGLAKQTKESKANHCIKNIVLWGIWAARFGRQKQWILNHCVV
ncbi:unnamed protein product [Pseudo-nitzschia multistriata]|uniref:E3 ubiquitin-protein ligase n=1 Tax=Pseudo-nitzschia multistriata TaxID=183589 RepID=A0A448ZCJ2_9STRA|nr:unnamed protein product [Pseudo-nitzschia multistriata]